MTVESLQPGDLVTIWRKTEHVSDDRPGPSVPVAGRVISITPAYVHVRRPDGVREAVHKTAIESVA